MFELQRSDLNESDIRMDYCSLLNPKHMYDNK